jgi:hypothetical protein
MEHHDIGCAQLSPRSAIEARGYVLRDKVNAVR